MPLHHFPHSLLRFCHRTELTWKSKCELTGDTQPQDLDTLLISMQESKNWKRYIYKKDTFIYIHTHTFLHIYFLICILIYVCMYVCISLHLA